MNITDYKVVVKHDLEELENAVIDHIRHGWIPQGGLVVVKHKNNSMSFGQAMVKPAPPKQPRMIR